MLKSRARSLSRFARSNLLTRFLLMAAAVLTAGMLIVGIWVAARIEDGVTDNAGALTALYVDALITPIVQELAVGETLSSRNSEELQRVLDRGALQSQIARFKLWTPSGTVAFSDDPSLVGQTPKGSPGLDDALAGRVHASFGRIFHAESLNGFEGPLLEVYSPVRSTIDGQIIAVAEFYTTAEALAGHLMTARFQTWVVVGAVSLGMLLVLTTVVAGGSRTIARQRQSLDEQVSELSVLLEKNSSLTQRLEQANHRIASLNEYHLRRISADLHDGPVQQLAFAALRLDTPQNAQQEDVRRAIEEAMKEIRDICSGLALPDLDNWSVATIARRLASVQEARTGTKVTLDIVNVDFDLSAAAKICVYRFIQEALNNSAKHAEATTQKILSSIVEGHLQIEVEDNGSGFDPRAVPTGLGLVGLRERVAGLKGRLDIESRLGGGTILRMTLPITEAIPEGQI